MTKNARNFWRPLATVMFVAAIAASGCRTPVRRDASAAVSTIRTSSGNRVAIVFVHGVLSSPQDAFTALNGVYWPELVKGDPLFSGADIYTYAYRSPWTHDALKPGQLADDMNQELDNLDVIQKHDKIAFVCHSMGGLIIRDYLTKFQSRLAAKVAFIYFFATPTLGSEMAAVGRVFLPNSQLANMSPSEGDEFLRELQSRWLDAGFGTQIASYCAYETQRMGVSPLATLVVGWRSASGLCNRSAIEIQNTNHSTIVKPTSTADKPHVALRNAYRSIVLPLTFPAVRMVSGRALTVSYDSTRRFIRFVFRSVIAGSPSGVIQDMYARLDNPDDVNSFIPFAEDAFSCILNGRDVTTPFGLQNGDLECIVSRPLGGLSRDPFAKPGDRTLRVTFETDESRGVQLQFCVNLTADTLSELRAGLTRRFTEAACASEPSAVSP